MKKAAFFFFVSFVLLLSADVRPVKDNVGFCWDKADLNKFLDFLKLSEKYEVVPYPFIAGISPHDDYLYAGKIYYPLFKNIRAREVVIFGVTHSRVREKIKDPKNILIFDEYESWKGPYKNVIISGLRDFLKEKLDKKYYIVSNEAHRLEHSIEAMIPFLQYHNRDVIITPIMVTEMIFEKMEELSRELSSAILDYMKDKKLKVGKDVFFLISADANHYGKAFKNDPYGEDRNAHKKGTEIDKNLINTYLNGNIDNNKIKGL